MEMSLNSFDIFISSSSLSIAAPSHWIPFVPSIGLTGALGRPGPDSRSDVSMECAFKPSGEGSLEGFSSLSVCSRVSRSAQNAQSVQRLIEMFVKQKAEAGAGVDLSKCGDSFAFE